MLVECLNFVCVKTVLFNILNILFTVITVVRRINEHKLYAIRVLATLKRQCCYLFYCSCRNVGAKH